MEKTISIVCKLLSCMNLLPVACINYYYKCSNHIAMGYKYRLHNTHDAAVCNWFVPHNAQNLLSIHSIHYCPHSCTHIIMLKTL